MTHCATSCSDLDCDFYVFLPFFFIFFFLFCSSRGAVEQDKLKRTGVADRGDEATIGKCGIKNRLGERIVGERLFN